MTQFPRVVVLMACATLAACEQAATSPPAIPSVFVSQVKNDLGTQVQIFSGSVRPRIESDLAFRAAGKVVSRLVDVGQVVRSGQVMARMDPEDYQLAVSAAREQARAAEVDATQAASDAARFRRLLAEGSISAADVERQQAKADAASARLAQAQQQLALASNRVAYTSLVAPFDGVVTAIRFESGQVVAEGQPVLTLARPGELEIVADIPEAVLPAVRSYKASVRLAEGGEHLPLRLRELAPGASAQTRTFRARYALGAPVPASLQIGMTAELHLSRDGQTATALLPAGALLSTERQATVWIVDKASGSLARRAVKVIATGTDTVRVSGLNEGELVVSAGAQTLDAGMKVRAQPRPLALATAAGGA